MELEITSLKEGLALILPAEVLARLRIATGDKVVLTQTEGGFEVSLLSAHVEKVDAATRVIMERYAETLRELAK